jgi:nucleoside-diphosphate-sugar epimerase
MRVLITGGAGFIGSHLADMLLAEGHSVRVVDNLDPQVHPDGARPACLNPEAEVSVADARDIARACALALTTAGADGHAVNVGTGVATSVLDVSDTLARGLGGEIAPEQVGQYRASDIRHSYADPRKAEQLLGFRAEIYFEQGIRDLLRWLQRREAVDQLDSAHEALVARGLAR